MQTKRVVYVITLVIGIVMLCLGFFVIKGEEAKSLIGLLRGLGVGISGMSLVELVRLKLETTFPEYKSKATIEDKDKKNLYINSLAKASTFETLRVLYIIATFIAVFAVGSLTIVLLFVGGYVLSAGIYISNLSKYSKEM